MHAGQSLSGMLLLCMLFLWTPQVRAELGSDAYVPDGPALSEEEREAVRKRIEAEQEAARLRREREAEAREVQVEDPRPFPERLTEQRCVGCHGRDLYETRGYTRLSAELTVLRVQWLHGARIEAGERQLIASHLAQRHPDTADRSLSLAGLGATLITAMSLVAIALIRRRKRLMRGS